MTIDRKNFDKLQPKVQRELLRDSIELIEKIIDENNVGRNPNTRTRLDRVDFMLGGVIDDLRYIRQSVQGELQEIYDSSRFS